MVGLETRLRTPRVTVFLGAAVFLVAAVGWMSPSRAAPGSSLADSALDPQAEGAIELREGVAIASTHERRTAVNIDPITAQVIAGNWSMPRSGDSVAFPGGDSRKWENVKAAADGWFSGGSLRGGYVAVSFNAAGDSVMMLEAAGHGVVYAGGEPRSGDVYSYGYVQLPVAVRKGINGSCSKSAGDDSRLA